MPLLILDSQSFLPLLLSFPFFSFLFLLFRAEPGAYGSSQARVRIGAAAAGLHHSSWQCRILSPPSEARDQTHVLMDASRVR